MPRRVRDFIEISEYTSLDTLIRFLETIRDNLPEDSEAEIKIRGDELSGRRLTISFMRTLAAEEADSESRLSGKAPPEPDPRIEELRRMLDRLP